MFIFQDRYLAVLNYQIFLLYRITIEDRLDFKYGVSCLAKLSIRSMDV